MQFLNAWQPMHAHFPSLKMLPDMLTSDADVREQVCSQRLGLDKACRLKQCGVLVRMLAAR